jgi:hypothetical protein
MAGYNLPGEDDPINLVRTIGRLAQMLLELRDEYVDGRRTDTLDQIERRLDEIARLHTQLTDLRRLNEQQDASSTSQS